jgi:hypothetical protein
MRLDFPAPPCCLVALLPLLSCRPTTLLPCCPTTLLSYYLITLLAALWGSRAALYNDCSQLRDVQLALLIVDPPTIDITLSPYTTQISATDSHRYYRRMPLSYLISFSQSILLIFARSSSTADTHEALPEVIMAQDNTLA